jgi:uncharacterized protein YciI
MKKYIAVLILIITIISGNTVYSQTPSDSTKNSSEKVEWEMKIYYFVFLNAVKDRPVIDSVTAMEIQKGHMANLERMYYEGKSKLAGPFMDGGEMRGIVVLDVATEEEAREQMSRDPAIINGRLEAVIKKWYGPAGLIVEPKARK